MPSDHDVVVQAARIITDNWLSYSPVRIAQALADAGLLNNSPPRLRSLEMASDMIKKRIKDD